MTNVRRYDWVVAITAALIAVGCSGSGCGGCGFEPIPGGFPSNERTAEAVQVRVTSSAIAKITADPAAVIAPLVGGGSTMPGTINFDIPGQCGGTVEICCVGGAVTPACGPLEIDLNRVGAEAPRLELVPQGGSPQLKLTLRARLKTIAPVPIKISFASCDMTINTAAGSVPDVTITADINLPQDSTSGTTRVEATNVNLANLQNDDVTFSGACALLGGSLKEQALNFLAGQLTGTIEDTVNEAVCKTCEGGTVAECGSQFASACTDGTCMVGSRCLQETGAVGRMRGAALFGAFSPGTTGSIDLYEVLGGYARTNNAGISLGMLGGMLPSGAPRDRCGPPGTKPALVDVAELAVFQNNTRESDAGTVPFDVGIGVHKSQIDQFAYAGYEGGLLCLTVGHTQVEQLKTDTLALLAGSLNNLVASSAPMAVGVRPQGQPAIALGRNTFASDGQGGTTLTEPLLDLSFTGLELDFFASVDEQYIRVFTVVTDMRLPVGLQAGANNEIVPVLGDLTGAFTNISVKNSEAVTQSPAEIAALFPTLLELVVGQLSGGLGGFELPALGGLTLRASSISTLENNTFLAIFADMEVGATARVAQVDTVVDVLDVTEPAVAIARDPARWTKELTPAVTVGFGNATNQEWSYRLNGGMWSAWSPSNRLRLAPRAFWIPGTHRIEVRARVIGHPESADLTPAVLELPIGDAVIARIGPAPFHGEAAGEGGCDCDSGGSRSGAGLLAILVLGLVLPLRRMARGAGRSLRRLGPVVWAAAIALVPGCDCGSDEPCGDTACADGEVANGGLGRYTSIAGDGTRVLVATYDTGLGDAVIADVTSPDAITYIVVDGVPDQTPTYKPDTYRGGIPDAGPNVGQWTSVAVANGLGRAAYHDVDNGSLRVAIEQSEGSWATYELDPGGAETVGLHTSMTVDGQGRVAVAYLAINVPGASAGTFVTELRLARASSVAPASASEWTFSTIAVGNGTCAGLCGAQSCIAGATSADPQTCVTPSNDCGMCGDDQACVAGACTDVIAAPTTSTLASGTGLYASLTTLSDGRLAVAYYDNVKHALAVSVETGAGASAFTETIVDANGDRGRWASARADGSGGLHIAYQDAIGDQLLYTLFAGTPGAVEVVDDGQRPGDRTHSVGASAALYLNGSAPVIAYQDGLVSDVYIAEKAGTWTTSALAAGPLLDGISIAATTGPGGAGYVAWDSIDPAADPIHHLVVRKQ